MVYSLNFNITYIIILATCFDSCESSSGINFQELLYIFLVQFLILSRTIAIGIPLCITEPKKDKRNCKTICTIVLEN